MVAKREARWIFQPPISINLIKRLLMNQYFLLCYRYLFAAQIYLPWLFFRTFLIHPAPWQHPLHLLDLPSTRKQTLQGQSDQFRLTTFLTRRSLRYPDILDSAKLLEGALQFISCSLIPQISNVNLLNQSFESFLFYLSQHFLTFPSIGHSPCLLLLDITSKISSRRKYLSTKFSEDKRMN